MRKYCCIMGVCCERAASFMAAKANTKMTSRADGRLEEFLAQIGGYLREYLCPVCGDLLPIQPDARIPGSVAAISHPAPVRSVGKKNPGLPSQRGAEVRNARIDSNDDIHALAQCRGGGEVLQLVHRGDELSRAQRLSIMLAHVPLQPEVLKFAGQVRQPIGKDDGASLVDGVSRVTTPGQAHTGTLPRAQS